MYKDVLTKRLNRKREQLAELEKQMNSVEGITTNHDKRRYIELKAVVQELESIADIAETMAEYEQKTEQ